MKNNFFLRKPISILLFVLLTFLTACSSHAELPFVNLYSDQDPDAVEQMINDDSLVLAIASVVSPKESLDQYKDFIVYLEKKLDRPITVIQKQTYGEVNQLLQDGKADITITCSLAFRIGKQAGYLEGLAAPVVDGAQIYQSYIITNIHNPYESLDDLQGKRFAFVDPISYSGRLSVLDLLNQKDQNAELYFEDTFYTYSHDYSIKAAANNSVDGAAVDSLVFDQLLAEDDIDVKSLKIIGKGEWAGTPPIVIHSELDPALKAELKDIILSMDEDSTGKRILTDLHVDKYNEINEVDYAIIDNLIKLLGEQL
ncbi:substrate-binding domain-containing protein [Calidifontibacillus oryziterrae]|uniref:substrate-binding domain-containing protein n=1 Tax=Calidifontibacillus oryziterrae TaxID=1191699 RepID=UPI00031F0E99|nr:phosphate/phosphite/phosphonate ABC transporter substrate-binding protein [Calidifontibacillus oryziterrae]